VEMTVMFRCPHTFGTDDDDDDEATSDSTRTNHEQLLDLLTGVTGVFSVLN